MAPSADFTHDIEQRMQTYNLCNVSPQDHNMNQQIWTRLEEWTRRVAYSHNQQDKTATYVVTGPLWFPAKQLSEKMFEHQYLAIGSPPSIVSVPTHFFKVVVVVQDFEITHYACFVFPNTSDAKDWRLEDGLVRLSDLEAVTGLQFFPSFIDSNWKREADLVVQLSSKRPALIGSGNESINAAQKKIGAKSVHHLCPNGSCHLFDVK